MDKKEISDQVRFNRQVNYKKIKSLWKYMHPKSMIEEFYKELNITRNYVSRIVTGNRYNTPDLTRKWQSKTKDGTGLYVLGLDKSYMVGEEMILLDRVKVSEWKDYIKYKYEEPKGAKSKYARQDFHERLWESFRFLKAGGVRETSDRAIDILYYYMVNGHARLEQDTKDIEIKELIQAMEHVKASDWKSCEDSLLRKSIKELEHQLKMARAVLNYKEM